MKKIIKELAQYLLIFVAVFAVHSFIIGTSRVEGKSMYPTLNEKVENDRVVVDKICLFNKNFNKGDVVIFKSYDEGKLYIKRIIGMPGDKVEIKDGAVYVNDNKINEDYLADETKTYPSHIDYLFDKPKKIEAMKVIVPENHVFVLGDNRGGSTDSRKIGPINMNRIKGKAIYKFNLFKFYFSEV